MGSILVVRGSGTRTGTDVVEPMLTSDAAKLARGRTELDSAAHSLEPVDLEQVAYREGVDVGQHVAVVDSAQGPSYHAKVTSVAYTFRGPEAIMSVSVLRPTNFTGEPA